MRKNRIKINKGFTLIEMLVVIGIISSIGALSMFMDINSYRGDAFRSEVSTLGTALQTARADSLNNINQKRHGVAINPSGYKGYIIFEGNSYATADHSLDVNIQSSYDITLSSTSPSEVVFEQLSGNANYDGDLDIIDSTRNMTAIISLNHEGKISW